MIFISIFLMTDTLKFFLYLLAISVFSFEKWLLKHFAYNIYVHFLFAYNIYVYNIYVHCTHVQWCKGLVLCNLICLPFLLFSVLRLPLYYEWTQFFSKMSRGQWLLVGQGGNNNWKGQRKTFLTPCNLLKGVVTLFYLWNFLFLILKH